MEVTAPELQTLWLNDLVTQSDARSFPFMRTFSRSVTIEGERRKYGTGRMRGYAKAGTTNDWSVSLPACTPEDVAWLETHANRTLVARDDRGHRIFAIYYPVNVSEHQYNKEGDIDLTLLEVTATLEV